MSDLEEFYNELLYERNIEKRLLSADHVTKELIKKLNKERKDQTALNKIIQSKDREIFDLKDELRVLRRFLERKDE